MMENNSAKALRELLEKEANQGYTSNNTENSQEDKENNSEGEENLVRKCRRRNKKTTRTIADSSNTGQNQTDAADVAVGDLEAA